MIVMIVGAVTIEPSTPYSVSALPSGQGRRG